MPVGEAAGQVHVGGRHASSWRESDMLVKEAGILFKTVADERVNRTSEGGRLTDGGIRRVK